MTDVEMIMKLTGEKDEELITLLFEESKETILVMTNRKKITPPLQVAAKKLTVVAYNRLGMEGETSRSEAGISSAFAEIPADIERIIKQNRLGRVSGHAYEKKLKEEILP